MGSLIMHYCIATEVTKMLNVDTNRFVMGGLAPDLPRSIKESKLSSHFMKKYGNGISYVDYRAFFQKYHPHFEDSFYMGYYCHLIADELWLRDIVYRYLNPLPPKERAIANQNSYADFWILNGILIKHFNLQDRLQLITNVEVEEINSGSLSNILERVHNDFKYDPSILNKSLAIWNTDLIFNYIAEAVKRSYHEITQLSQGI